MTMCVSVLYLLVSGTQSSGTLKMHNALMECDKNKIKWGIKELHICVHIFRDRMIQSHTEPRWRDEDVYLRRWKTTKNKNLIEFKLFKEIIQFYHHCDRTRKFVSLTYLFIIFFFFSYFSVSSFYFLFRLVQKSTILCIHFGLFKVI